MEKTITRPDAETGTTTAKKMTRTEIKEDKMFAIRESIEKSVRPLAEMCFKFEKSINEITHKEAGFGLIYATPNFIMQEIFYSLCDKVMLSRMSADDKLDILNKLGLLVEYVNEGGYLTACSKNKKDWDEVVKYNADQRIAEHKKRGEK